MDPSMNPETGESVTQGRSPRFSMWVALTVFSIVVMGASVELKNDLNDAEGYSVSSSVRWAVACSSITLAVGCVVILAHLNAIFSTFIVGTPVEGILVTGLAVCWGCTVAVVTDKDDGTALAEFTGAVSNANLYYFSWFCFVTAVIMFVNYSRHAFGLDLVSSTRGDRLNHWAALLATALVVAGASGRSLNDYCKEDLANSDLGGLTEYCKRTKLGIATGVIGVFMAAFVVVIKTCRPLSPAFLELGSAILATVLNAFGVAFITSNKGPGASIGNLYYFSWASFLLAAFLVAECMGQKEQAPTEGEKESANGEIEIEPGNFDDRQ